MESIPIDSARQFGFADYIPEPTTGRNARLSIISFDGIHVSSEESSSSNGLFNHSINKAEQHSQQEQLQSDPASTSDKIHRSLFRSVLLPVIAIVLPISLVSAILVGLVCGYRVETEPSLFRSSTNGTETASHAYILVNYSATRLVFLASWISTMAPILASFVMVLWSLPTAQTMRTASVELNPQHLPTPYQLSLVVGLTLASTDRLRQYLGYSLSRSRPSIPPVLHKAALMLILCFSLACGVFIADTALHYYTETVPFDRYVTGSQTLHSLSRGTSDQCLSWNRTEMFCLPCTAVMWQTYSEEVAAIAAENEVPLLQYNHSMKSEIRFVLDPALQHGDLAILIPKTQTIPTDVDYRGTTVGVSTQCSLITQDCKPQHINRGNLDTQFNCSDQFFGVLGLPPVVTDSGDSLDQAVDPNVPVLNWKQFLNLQYGYYADPKLTTPYNTGLYNSSTGAAEDDPVCMPETDMINPVYMGLAGRFDTTSQSALSNLSLQSDSGFLKGVDTYVDFMLSCSYTTYEVNYTWASGNIEDTSYTISPNGTLAEMYHGSLMYSDLTGGAHDLEIDMLQAAQQESSEEFLRSWANSYSVGVLSKIGAYMTARPNVKEQRRTAMLVAKVPQAALWALIACSLTYVLLGFALGFSAYCLASINVQDIAARLSLAGLTAAAFEERDGTGNYERINKNADHTFGKGENGTRRVGVEGLAETGYILNPMISAAPTPQESRSSSSRYLPGSSAKQVDFV